MNSFDYENAEMFDRMEAASKELQEMMERLHEIQAFALSPDQKVAQRYGRSIGDAADILRKTMYQMAGEAEVKFDRTIE